VRRQTFIMIVILFVLLAGAATAQIIIATSHHALYPGPLHGTELPSFSVTAPPPSP